MFLSLVNWLFGSTITYFIIFLTVFYYYSTFGYDKLKKENISHEEPWPLFGNVFKMLFNLEKQTDTFGRMYKRFANKRYCGFYQMKTPILMIRDPELINNILIKDFSHFTGHGIHSNPETNFLANSIFFADGPRWKIMRHKLSPGFTSGKLKFMYGQIQKCSDELMNYIYEKSKANKQLDMNEIMAKYVTDVIGTCAFGLKLDAVKSDDSDFRKYGRKLFRPTFRSIFSNMIKLISPKLLALIKFNEFPNDLTDFYYSTFKEVIKYREENNIDRNDVAQTLMQARNDLVLNNAPDAEEKFTDDDIVGNAVVMFIAGSEPMFITLATCLHQLAMNPHVQEKMRKHVIETKEKHGGNINNEFLVDLHYADMVLAETLRKFNANVALFRETTKTYQVPNDPLVIEKGQKIIIPMYSIHHDPKYYPNPQVFDPERFSPEEKAKRPRGTNLSFGDGPRLCIGKRFAELVFKLALSEILLKFEVVPCEKTVNSIELQNGSVTMILKGGIWLSLNPISL